MLRLTIRCEVDGHETARYEFDCNQVETIGPEQGGGPAIVEFVPCGDVVHRLTIDSDPPGHSGALKQAAGQVDIWEPPS